MVKKRATYWNVLRDFYKELYKSKLYWISGVLIIISFAIFFANRNLIKVSLIILIIGIILLAISKIIIFRKEIKL